MSGPIETTLELTPRRRVDFIDVTEALRRQATDLLESCRRVLYCSHHTTAGFPDQGLVAELQHRRESLDAFLQPFRHLFPPGAPYQHDEMHLRDELSAEQRLVEPRNADSHLTFISSGLHNVVTYDHRPGEPVWFVDLDGVHEHGVRRRNASVVGFSRETVVGYTTLEIPVSEHPIDSINLCAPELGLVERLQEQIHAHGVTVGRLDLVLADSETHAGLTVNEYETLLMQRDLREVLADPLRFVAAKTRNMLRDPRSVPHKTINYAQYDLVQVFKEIVDKVGHGASLVEEIIARVITLPSQRFFGMKRSASFLVRDVEGEGWGSIVQGTYQSPILIQWRRAGGGTRRLRARLVRFE